MGQITILAVEIDGELHLYEGLDDKARRWIDREWYVIPSANIAPAMQQTGFKFREMTVSRKLTPRAYQILDAFARLQMDSSIPDRAVRGYGAYGDFDPPTIDFVVKLLNT